MSVLVTRLVVDPTATPTECVISLLVTSSLYGPTATPTEYVIVSLLVTRLVVLLRVTAVTLTVLLMSDGHWWRLLFKMLFVPPRVMSSGSYYVLSLSYCPDGCPVVP